MKAIRKLSFQAMLERQGRHRSWWLMAPTVGIVASVLLLILCFLASLPFYYEYLRDSCYSSLQECSNATMSAITIADVWGEAMGISASGLAMLHIGIDFFIFFCFAFVGALILLLKPKDVLGSITAFTLVAFAFGDLVYREWEGSAILVPFVQLMSLAGLMGFALLFPSGRVTRRWLWRVALFAFVVRFVPGLLPFEAIQTDKWPLELSLAWLIVFYGTLAYSQITQYRENVETQARQAIRKVAFGFIGAFIALICVNLSLLVWPQLYRSDTFWLDFAIRLIMLVIPYSLGSALLKDRLWGVPPVVRTSMVYAMLLIIVFGIYMGTVWYLALVFQSSSGVFPLIATGLVAVLFSPLKEGVDKLVNRIVYGRRENPVTFLVSLGDRLKEPYAPEKVLETVVSTVQEMMKLTHASITILVDGQEQEAAAAGSPRGHGTVRFPLVMGGEELGGLHVSPRSPDEPLSKTDLRLLHLLGRESARIVHGLKQSLDISRLMRELQASREKLIFAREEERRSIRNNMHDDLAPRLAALALSASAAEDFIRKDPPRAALIVSELESDILVIVSEIREFVHNLRPPALDQYGLIEAIRQRADRLMVLQAAHGDGEHVRIEVDGVDSWPVLPAAVEVAVYRIVSEALTNVVKHSRAGLCKVALTRMNGPHNEELHVVVEDDGVGIPQADQRRPGHLAEGVGLTSIRERAVELGGRSRISAAAGGGVRIEAWLPLQIHSDWRPSNENVEDSDR